MTENREQQPSRTDTERLALVSDYIEGVEPLMIVITRIYNETDDEPARFVVREVDSMAALGIGDELGEALDDFCDYYEREYPRTDPEPKAGGA